MDFFKKLFGKKEGAPTSKSNEPVKPLAPDNNPSPKPAEVNPPPESISKTGLDTPMEEVKKSTEGYVSLGRNIFPAIKSVDDPGIKLTKNSNPMITSHIADGIVLCYVIDIGDKLERICESHLKQFNLDADTIHKTAMRNLIDKVNGNTQIKVYDYSKTRPEIKPFYGVEFDSNYNPSIMMLDEFWDTTAKEVCKSDLIAVSIPANNIIFFSDFKLMESFRTMRPVANNMYDASIEDRLNLTKETYIRKDNKWIKFLDTEEQFIELMDY